MKRHLAFALALLFYGSILPPLGIPADVITKATNARVMIPGTDNSFSVNDAVTVKINVWAYMDGLSGRPTLAEWEADQAGTDATAAVKAAIDSLIATGGTVFFPDGIYKVTDGFYVRGNVNIAGNGSTSRIIQTGTSFPTSTVLFHYQSPTATTYTATGSLSAGETTITLDNVTGLSEGQEVFLQLGEALYDATQPYLCMFNRITDITGSDVTFSVPIHETVNGTSHTILSLTTIVQGVTISNLSLEADSAAQPDQAMYIERCRNVKVSNIVMNHTGSIINAQSENVWLENIYFKRARIWGAYGASGNMIGGWGFRNYYMKNIFGMDIDKNGIYLEAEGRGALIENYVYNVGAGYTSSGYGAWIGGNCKGIVIKNAHFNAPYPNYYGPHIAENAEVRTEDIFLYNGTLGQGFMKRHRGLLGWDRDTGTMEYYEKINHYTTKITLDNAATTNYVLPSGIYKRVRAYASDTTGITGLHFLSGASSAGDFYASLVTGSTVDLSTSALTSLGPSASYPFNNTFAKSVTIYTDNTIAAGAYLVIAAEFYGIDNDAAQGMIQNTE